MYMYIYVCMYVCIYIIYIYIYIYVYMIWKCQFNDNVVTIHYFSLLATVRSFNGHFNTLIFQSCSFWEIVTWKSRDGEDWPGIGKYRWIYARFSSENAKICKILSKISIGQENRACQTRMRYKGNGWYQRYWWRWWWWWWWWIVFANWLTNEMCQAFIG